MTTSDFKLCYNSLYTTLLISKMTRPEGIEPPSQESESYVISTTLRAQARLLV